MTPPIPQSGATTATEESSSTTPESTNTDEEIQQSVLKEPREALDEIYWYIINNEGNITPEQLTVGHVVRSLAEEGLWFWRDHRFRECQDVALSRVHRKRTKYTNKVTKRDQQAAEAHVLDFSGFCEFLAPRASLFLKAFSEELVIPDWRMFETDMTYHFLSAEKNREGQTAQYIPILKTADPEKWALSVCSTDGQRFSIGDYQTKFSIQSVSKPVTYALCLDLDGEKLVDEWIGVEPAGRPFNTQDLDMDTQKPFNASINSGAIMAAGLFASRFPDLTWVECVDRIRQTWHELCGNDLDIGFSQETFESEKETAFNNFAIAYNLKGRKGLPRNVDLHKMLDLYLGCCSIEMTTEALAVAAATLANGGVCPITQKEVFPAHVVRHVLSETMLCGMYDQAGHFAVQVGLPAKSGVSGVLMIIVPNVFGFATFSPRLNKNGNSVRGIDFCKRLVASYRVHIFEPLRSGNAGAKVDPRANGWKSEQTRMSRMAWALQVGDTWATHMRDIFLFALVHAACSSREGLSARMKQTIQDHYELVYQMPLADEMFNEVIETVEANPSDMRILENLTKDETIPDSFRNVILMAIIELMMIDDQIDEVEKSVAVRITVLLGIDRHVALMEINRYEGRVGHRFKDVDPCEMGDSLFSTSSMRSSHLFSIRDQIQSMSEDFLEQNEETAGAAKSKSKLGVRMATEAMDEKNRDETILLRREVFRLKRKVDKLTRMLHEARARGQQQQHHRSYSDMSHRDASLA